MSPLNPPFRRLAGGAIAAEGGQRRPREAGVAAGSRRASSSASFPVIGMETLVSPRARFAAVPLIVVAAACSDGRSETLVDATLERDLQLASTSIALAPVSGSQPLIEIAPKVEEAPAPRPTPAASGPRRVRSPRPTTSAAPAPESAPADAESVLETITQPTAEASVAVGEVLEEDAGAALPRPTPAVVDYPVGGGGDGDYDGGRSGGGGGIWGGVVIRGGDVDDCRIGPPRRTTTRRPSSGVGTSRWPVSDRGQSTAGGSTRDRSGPVWRRAGGSGGSSGGARSGGEGGGRWGRGRQ